MFTLDHIVLAAESLAEGTAYAEAALGLPLAPGGQHLFMGTHNRLLSLGPDTYLEVIAIDPDLPAPDRARWFGLDDFSGPPRLVSWVWAARDVAAAGHLPADYAAPESFARGDLTWDMALPIDGPLGAMTPGVIAWGNLRPQGRLADVGVRLLSLSVSHPQADDWPAPSMPGVTLSSGPAGMQARLSTPRGEAQL